MLFGTNINLNGNEIQNVVIHLGVAFPVSPSAGQLFYRTDQNVIYWYDGTSWRDVRYINDAGTTTTDLLSAQKIQNQIDAAVSGSVEYQGGYDASAVGPNGAATKGDMYTVTVGGTGGGFWSTTLEVGDVIISEIDSPTVEADWTVVEKNLTGALQAANNLSDVTSAATSFDNIKQSASTTFEGVVEIADQTEVNAGTDALKPVTPATLAGYVSNEQITKKYSVDLNGAGEASVTRTVGSGVTTYTVTHSLGTLDIQVMVKDIASGDMILTDYTENDANNVDIIFNGTHTDNTVRAVIIG
jgi:hypothetical protein